MMKRKRSLKVSDTWPVSLLTTEFHFAHLTYSIASKSLVILVYSLVIFWFASEPESNLRYLPPPPLDVDCAKDIDMKDTFLMNKYCVFLRVRTHDALRTYGVSGRRIPPLLSQGLRDTDRGRHIRTQRQPHLRPQLWRKYNGSHILATLRFWLLFCIYSK